MSEGMGSREQYRRERNRKNSSGSAQIGRHRRAKVVSVSGSPGGSTMAAAAVAETEQIGVGSVP